MDDTVNIAIATALNDQYFVFMFSLGLCLLLGYGVVLIFRRHHARQDLDWRKAEHAMAARASGTIFLLVISIYTGWILLNQ